jgi:DNA-directed RNA polymerase II subunit RPB2
MQATSDLPFRTLNAYYEQTPLFLTRHHIDSYEHFVFNEMPQLIHSMNPITIFKDPLSTEQGIYRYKTEIYLGGKVETAADLRLELGAPIITLDGGKTIRRMFPNEARLRGLTYSSQMRMDIDIVVTQSEKKGDTFESVERVLPFKNFPLLKLPILLRSKLCSLGEQSSDDDLTQKGESPLEHGGFFIIDGAEKLLITRQEQAFNSLYIARKSPTDLDVDVYASVVSQHPETKLNRRCSVYLMRDKNTIRVSVPSLRGMIPVFILFRALGIESDSDIVRLIFPDKDSPFTKLYEDLLVPSIEDAWPITTQAMAIHFMSTVTHQGSVASVLDILRNNLFSHVPNKPKARAYYLAEMVQKIIKSKAKLIANTDRDDIRNQRLLTTGTLIRDLFSAVWKDWTKTVSLAVDTQYNYNKTLYEGEKFLDLFAAGNAASIFQVESLNTGLMKGFRGRWGTNPKNTKTGVLQPVARISYLDAMSHCRRILLDFDTSMKQKGPRHLHTSQIGYFCTNETPTGAHIGVTKNYSMLTYVSIAAPVQPLVNWLEQRAGMVFIGNASLHLRANGTLIKINGGGIGFVEEPSQLVRVLKLLKWTACLAPLASVCLNTTDREIRIFLDEGRPVRPLWHLEKGGQLPPAAQRLVQNPDSKPVWREIVLGTLPYTKNRKISDVEFLDPLLENKEATLSEYEELLQQHMGGIEYVDPYESNEAYISWWGASDLGNQHTHIEIHPSTMLGLMVSMIPFANHNQSPRNQLSCSQSKQSLGYYATNYLQRYDTYGSQLCYGEAPLVRTLTYDHVGRGQVPYGFNCIVAMASTDGYNQDDGILFNRSAIERGMFRSLALRSYSALEEVDPISKVVYKVNNPKLVPAWTSLRSGYDYSKLDENGIIRVGEAIEDYTILVGRYLENPETHTIKDASVIPVVFTKGRVESVVILNQANGMRLIKIRILQERIPELGDKFGSRHGQKGTMGMVIPAENMPHTAEGIIPDVIVNPHGLTSRMTVAQLLEVLFGRFGAESAAKCNGTTFFNRDDIVKTIGDSLQSLGLHPHTENLMYSGLTGRQLKCSIFMGPLYFMRMKHLTSDKINSRGEGRREMRTHQPTGGRGNEGGMRIGEMECHAIQAHGASLFMQESMMKRADATNFWICNGCGTIPIYNEKEKLFVCPMCDGPVEFSGSTEDTLALIPPLRRSRVTFSKVEMPYALKLLDQELTTFMNTGFRYVTERTVGKLRDSMLKWTPQAGGYDISGSDISGSDISGADIDLGEFEMDISGGGIPPAPPQVQKAEASLAPIPASSLTMMPTTLEPQQAPGFPKDELAPATGGSQMYASATGDEPYVVPNPFVQSEITKAPSSVMDDGGILIPQLGGQAPVGFVDPPPPKQSLEFEIPSPQTGGEMLVSEMKGTDIKPDTFYAPQIDKEPYVVPNPFVSPVVTMPAPVPAPVASLHAIVQKGGDPMPVSDMKGTDIKPNTFYAPQVDKEPYVIPNPLVSPPIQTPAPAPAPAPAPQVQQPAPAQATQPVSNDLFNEVMQKGGRAINLFENAEIRVIKMA